MRRRVIVTGEVQGVFFRDATRRRAESLGVAGWVANREDGTVEAVFEGEPDAVEGMVSFCGDGPGNARVAGAEVTDEPEQGQRGFEVR